jgi:hypothetical protein
LPRLSTKLGKRKPEKGNVEDMTVEERLAMLNTTNENAKVTHNFFLSRRIFFMYDIQHCFICRPSDSTESEDAGIEPRTVATAALAVRRS